MPAAVKKFSSQASPEVLKGLHAIAKEEGRQFQAVLDEALRQYIEGKKGAKPRRQVAEAFSKSLSEFDALYRELAK